ncbi:ribonuclease H-like domain, reverse transcriptase, RNA-dependent DNA polymerase [Tanacetum coccineum]
MAQRDQFNGRYLPLKHTTQVCDVCLIGKHSRAPFPKKAKARSTSPLDLVYGDLCGPIIPPTPSEKKYIFLLVDDYSRYMWEYFLKSKDQAFDTFKEYKKSIENELRTTLKILRTDRGGEFTSNEFTQYCKDNDNTLKSLDFKKCALEQAIYTKTSKDSTLLIGVYVDDLLITGIPKKEIDKFKDQMEEKFEMSDLGLLAYYLGIEVTQTGSDISIRQSAYANKILKEAGMIDRNETLIPKAARNELPKVTGRIQCWSTQKQATVALSSCESEFIAATQALWLKRLQSKITHSQEEKVTIQVDNKSAIALMKNPVFHGRSKHIDTKYHFIRECVEREDIQVEFVSGEYQKADILTKALPKIKFLTMRQLIGLKDLLHTAFC